MGASAEELAEAAGSCAVIHKASTENEADSVTCFENIALERTAFESGVCLWQTDSQATANLKVTTKFVAQCPLTYSAYCDRLVLDAKTVVPVKIFLYDDSPEVLSRAASHCRSGGGKWHLYAEHEETAAQN